MYKKCTTRQHMGITRTCLFPPPPLEASTILPMSLRSTPVSVAACMTQNGNAIMTWCSRAVPCKPHYINRYTSCMVITYNRISTCDLIGSECSSRRHDACEEEKSEASGIDVCMCDRCVVCMWHRQWRDKSGSVQHDLDFSLKGREQKRDASGDNANDGQKCQTT